MQFARSVSVVVSEPCAANFHGFCEHTLWKQKVFMASHVLLQPAASVMPSEEFRFAVHQECESTWGSLLITIRDCSCFR